MKEVEFKDDDMDDMFHKAKKNTKKKKNERNKAEKVLIEKSNAAKQHIEFKKRLAELKNTKGKKKQAEDDQPKEPEDFRTNREKTQAESEKV